MSNLYVGDFGMTFYVETSISLAAAVVTEIQVKKPNGINVIWPATVVGTQMVYTIQLGDLDQSGKYVMQAFAEFYNLQVFGDAVEFYVLPMFGMRGVV